MSDSHLYEYVKITQYTVDAAWMSHSVKAVITPMLCVPLLLGLPFLTVNHIVADFQHCSVIDRNNKYDLLNPPVIKRQKLLSKPKATVMEVKKAKRLVLNNLRYANSVSVKEREFPRRLNLSMWQR